jgi:thiol:disulfide interchange protein DsbD
MYQRFIRHLQSGAFAILLLIPLFSSASEDSTRIITPHLTASLISEHNGLVPGRANWLALHFEIIPEWHTYWSNAGDSGNPPAIDWQLPNGFTAIALGSR